MRKERQMLFFDKLKPWWHLDFLLHFGWLLNLWVDALCLRGVLALSGRSEVIVRSDVTVFGWWSWSSLLRKTSASMSGGLLVAFTSLSSSNMSHTIFCKTKLNKYKYIGTVVFDGACTTMLHNDHLSSCSSPSRLQPWVSIASSATQLPLHIRSV